MLTKDIDQRLTIDKVKEHPWITNNGTDPMPKNNNNKIKVTERDLKSAFTKVRLIARVLL